MNLKHFASFKKLASRGRLLRSGLSGPSSFALAAFAMISAAASFSITLVACNSSDDEGANGLQRPGSLSPGACQLVPAGPAGSQGATTLQAQPVVTGLEVPWEVAFLPGVTGGIQDALVTERPGRLRLLKIQGDSWRLAPTPVLALDVVQSGEGGLLGLALDPDFGNNSFIYLYSTHETVGEYVNRVERYRLSTDHASAALDRVILDGIRGNSVHDGGRIQFGPDKRLYVATGDARDTTTPRNPSSLNGKILAVPADGGTPSVFAQGLRNPQGFDFWDEQTLVLSDNGPTGEYQGRTGGDELMIAKRGEDMGWPTIWHCEVQDGMISPILTWTNAVPPGGLLVYRGDEIPGWKNNILIASTGAEHLHRVTLASNGAVASHEMYLSGAASLGRLRTVFQGPRGELYVTTSNCDSRGSCPVQKDAIYRLTAGTPNR